MMTRSSPAAGAHGCRWHGRLVTACCRPAQYAALRLSISLITTDVSSVQTSEGQQPRRRLNPSNYGILKPYLQALGVDGAQQAGGTVLQQQQDALVAGRHCGYLQGTATGGVSA